MKYALFMAAAVVAGCQPAKPAASGHDDGPSTGQVAPAMPDPALVSTLAGEWRVAGIDGQALDQPQGLALSADREEIWWAPRCAGLVRTYRIAGAAFATGPAKGFRQPLPGEAPPPVCAIGLPPRLHEVSRAIMAATTIRRTPNNGVELAGGGHSLLLFTQ